MYAYGNRWTVFLAINQYNTRNVLAQRSPHSTTTRTKTRYRSSHFDTPQLNLNHKPSSVLKTYICTRWPFKCKIQYKDTIWPMLDKHVNNTSHGSIQSTDLRSQISNHLKKKLQKNIVLIWVWKQKERKENVLFNDALNTFYLWLYGIRHGKGPFR